MLRRLFVVPVTLTFALALAAGCKSGEGERCQLNTDCDDGLVCAESTNTCVESVAGGADGGVDAAIDASEADASPDAMVIDALEIDALEIDAAIDAAIDAP